jgi:hypothetical protein
MTGEPSKYLFFDFPQGSSEQAAVWTAYRSRRRMGTGQPGRPTRAAVHCRVRRRVASNHRHLASNLGRSATASGIRVRGRDEDLGCPLRRRSDVTAVPGHGHRVAKPLPAAAVGCRSISRNPPFGCDGDRRRHHRSPAMATRPAGQDSAHQMAWRLNFAHAPRGTKPAGAGSRPTAPGERSESSAAASAG